MKTYPYPNRAAQSLLISLLWLVPALTRAETAVEAWVQRYNGPGGASDFASSLAVDGSNNVVVTGRSSGSSSGDYLTIQYSSAGSALWTNRYTGLGNGSDSAASAVVVDASNNVIVTGASNSGGNPGYVTPGLSDSARMRTLKRASTGR